MSDWIETTLADVCSQVDYGFTASASSDSDLPRFLRITDIVGSHIDWETVPGCEIDRQRLAKFGVRAGDIVVARTGATVGHAKRIRTHPECVFASYLVRFRPSDQVNASFLGAVVESSAYKQYVLQHAGGAAQPNANAGVLGSYPFLLPDIETQHWIGRIHDAIEDSLANLRRRVELLEQMARAIYREWFVHFRYPGYEGDTLVDSPPGSIPDGWMPGTVGELVGLERATIDPTAVPGDTPAVGLEHIPRHRLTLDAWGNAGELGSRKTVFGAGDILFGKIRPYFHKVCVAPIGGVCSTDAIVLRPVTNHWGLAVHTIAGDEFVANATQTSNGTKMPRADWKVIKDFPVAIPPEDLSQRFTEIAFDAQRLANVLMFEGRELSSIRDLLLPRLVTGKIDVSSLDLDALVEQGAA